jgi:hypothetical protein
VRASRERAQTLGSEVTAAAAAAAAAVAAAVLLLVVKASLRRLESELKFTDARLQRCICRVALSQTKAEGSAAKNNKQAYTSALAWVMRCDSASAAASRLLVEPVDEPSLGRLFRTQVAHD